MHARAAKPETSRHECGRGGGRIQEEKPLQIAATERMTEMRGISTREERKLYVDQSILNERQDSQQVKVDNTVQGMAMSAMATRRGTDETSSEASMRIMKKSVLHALFTVSKPPLPAPFPAPILIAIPAQTI
jgi:hypothetical protein